MDSDALRSGENASLRGADDARYTKATRISQERDLVEIDTQAGRSLAARVARPIKAW